ATIQFIQTANGQRGPVEVALRGNVLPQDAFLVVTRAYSLNGTFNKLFHDYAPAHVVARYDAFEAANGRDLDGLRRLAIATTGKATTEAQLSRWLDISEQLSNLVREMLIATVDSVSAEGEQMLSEARLAMFIYLGITVVVLGVVVWLSRKV